MIMYLLIVPSSLFITAQIKLGKADKELGDNFYRKGDGTGCYYFSLNDLRDLFVNKDDDGDGNGKRSKIIGRRTKSNGRRSKNDEQRSKNIEQIT